MIIRKLMTIFSIMVLLMIVGCDSSDNDETCQGGEVTESETSTEDAGASSDVVEEEGETADEAESDSTEATDEDASDEEGTDGGEEEAADESDDEDASEDEDEEDSDTE